MCPLMTFFFFLVKLIHLTELCSWQWYEKEHSMDGGGKGGVGGKEGPFSSFGEILERYKKGSS